MNINNKFLQTISQMTEYGAFTNHAPWLNSLDKLIRDRKQSGDYSVFTEPSNPEQRIWNLAIARYLIDLNDDNLLAKILFGFTFEEFRDRRWLPFMNCGQMSDLFVSEAEKLGYEALVLVTVDKDLSSQNRSNHPNIDVNDDSFKYPSCGGHCYVLLRDDNYYTLLNIERTSSPNNIKDCMPTSKEYQQIHKDYINNLYGAMLTDNLMVIRMWKQEAEYIRSINDWNRLCYHHNNGELFPNFNV